MEEDLEIIDMGKYSKEEILRQIANILNDSEIERFTLLLKRKVMANTHRTEGLAQKLDELIGTTTRPKSSTIDKYYRTSLFANHQKTMSGLPSDFDIPDDESLPDSPKDLGIKLYRQAVFGQAAEIFEQLRQDFPIEKKDEMYAQQYREILIYLGNSYFQLKQYERAVKIYKELLQDQGSGVSGRVRGQMLNNLGCCYGKMGYEKLSMNAYSSALKIYSKFQEIDCAPLLANIANIYYNCHMYPVAEKYYLEAITERKNKKPSDKQLLYHAYHKLSLAQVHQSQFKEAAENLDKALKLAEHGYGDAVEILKESAHVRELQDKWEEALEFYEKMHEFYEKEGRCKGFIFQKVAVIYFNLGKFTEQNKYVKLALQQYVRVGDARKVSQLSNKRSIISQSHR